MPPTLRNILSRPTLCTGIKIGKFLAAGLPSFLLAVPLNYLLVEQLTLNKPLAYALVLFFQVIINFFMCRQFVFTQRSSTPIWLQFSQFTSGILFFRLADWALYSLLVSVFNFYFLVIQITNIFIFAILKFKFAQKTMEG